MEYRTFTDFLAYVDTADFTAAANGDEAARRRIAEKLDGVDLYFHGGPNLPDMGKMIGVTLADLLCHGIIPRVTLHKSE